MDVPELAVLEQRGGDEQPVVGRFLDERDDRGHPVRRAGKLGETRIVEAHRDLGREVLELVAGQPQLGEDDEVRAEVARLAQPVVVGREIDLERPEPGRDLGERDAHGLHARSIRDVPEARAAPGTRPRSIRRPPGREPDDRC